jgi:hypothetical protein
LAVNTKKKKTPSGVIEIEHGAWITVTGDGKKSLI